MHIHTHNHTYTYTLIIIPGKSQYIDPNDMEKKHVFPPFSTYLCTIRAQSELTNAVINACVRWRCLKRCDVVKMFISPPRAPKKRFAMASHSPPPKNIRDAVLAHMACARTVCVCVCVLREGENVYVGLYV